MQILKRARIAMSGIDAQLWSHVKTGDVAGQ